VYPHDVDGGVAVQQYLPDALAERVYYRPTRHGAEAAWGDIAQRLQRARQGHD
jgi:putative ATPase